jgi:hypothetical protein
MKRRIERRHLRHAGEERARRVDARAFERVVARGERLERAQPVFDGVVDADGTGEPVAAVDDPVTDGAQRIEVGARRPQRRAGDADRVRGASDTHAASRRSRRPGPRA